MMNERYSKSPLLMTLCVAAGPLFWGCSEKPEAVSLFDGKSLNGWRAISRLYVPGDPEFEDIPSAELRDATVRHHEESSNAVMRAKVENKGVWEVVDGGDSWWPSSAYGFGRVSDVG